MAFPKERTKLALAAWLETHTLFRLPTQAHNVTSALEALEASPQPISYTMQFMLLKRYFNRLILGGLALAFVLGLLAVPPAFAVQQSSQVNVFWLFIILLGMHLLNLAVWIVSMLGAVLRPMKQHSTNKGMLLTSLIFISKKVCEYSHIDNNVTAAYLNWQCPTESNKWLASSLSHGAWGCYLLAGWLMTFLLLLTNQVDFVWETTLLSDDAFITLTQTLSIIPQSFGLSLPNPSDILASQVDLVSQSPSTRQHWATFLLASIMIYGVLPRLLFTLICVCMYSLTHSSVPLSIQERLIQNRYRQPEQQSKKVIDHDAHGASVGKNTPKNELKETLDEAAFLHSWGLFEWSAPQPNFLSKTRSLWLLNSREEQARFLANPNQSPTYILVDATQSPDRGSRRFFSQVSDSYSSVLLVISGDDEASFIDDWQRLAQEVHLPVSRIMKKD